MHETDETTTQSGRVTKLATVAKRSCSILSLIESSLSIYKSLLAKYASG